MNHFNNINQLITNQQFINQLKMADYYLKRIAATTKHLYVLNFEFIQYKKINKKINQLQNDIKQIINNNDINAAYSKINYFYKDNVIKDLLNKRRINKAPSLTKTEISKLNNILNQIQSGAFNDLKIDKTEYQQEVITIPCYMQCYDFHNKNFHNYTLINNYNDFDKKCHHIILNNLKQDFSKNVLLYQLYKKNQLATYLQNMEPIKEFLKIIKNQVNVFFHINLSVNDLKIYKKVFQGVFYQIIPLIKRKVVNKGCTEEVELINTILLKDAQLSKCLIGVDEHDKIYADEIQLPDQHIMSYSKLITDESAVFIYYNNLVGLKIHDQVNRNLIEYIRLPNH